MHETSNSRNVYKNKNNQVNRCTLNFVHRVRGSKRNGDENVIKNDISIAIAFKLTAERYPVCEGDRDWNMCMHCIAWHGILYWTSYATLRKSGRRFKTKRSNQRYWERCDYTRIRTMLTMHDVRTYLHNVCDFILNKYTDHSFTLELAWLGFTSFSFRACFFLSSLHFSVFIYSLVLLSFGFCVHRMKDI